MKEIKGEKTLAENVVVLDLFSVPEAARALGTSRGVLHWVLDEYKISHFRIGRYRFLDKSTVEELRNRLRLRRKHYGEKSSARSGKVG
jgi:hypothetical protein